MEPQSAVLVVAVPALPPGNNHMYCHTRDGRHFLTAAAQTWLKLAALMTIRCKSAYCWRDPGGEFEVHIWHSDQRKDIDAPIKIVLDGVFKALGLNDHRINRLIVERITSETPTVRVEITPTQERLL